MKSTYYNKVLIMAGVLVFYLNVPLYVYQHHGLNKIEAPKHWVILFCLLSLPVLLRQMTVWNAIKSPVMVWCFGYAWLTVLWFFQSSQSDLAWQEVRLRFLAMIEIVTFLMIFWEPSATRLARKTLVGAVLLAVALNIYEVFAPMTFSQVLGRSAGLYMNPNMAGEALVLGMILSVTVLQSRYRSPFIWLTGLGILSTLSRASILAWGIAVAGLLFVRGVSSKDFLRSGFLGLVLVILILLPRWDQLLTTWERTGVMNVGVMERLAWFTDPSGISDYSSWERKYVAERAWDKISENPVLGSGTGSFHQAAVPPHNGYLLFMLDHGLIGALILPLLILAATWGARGESKYVAVVFGCVIMMLSLFTDTILNTAYSLILVSLMAAISAASRYEEITRRVAVEAEGVAQARGLVRA